MRFGLIYRISSYWELSYNDEIWFYLQDMGFSGYSCYWPLGRTNWASVLDRCQGFECFNELIFFLGLVNGPARLFLNLISNYECSIHILVRYSSIVHILKNVTYFKNNF